MLHFFLWNFKEDPYHDLHIKKNGERKKYSNEFIDILQISLFDKKKRSNLVVKSRNAQIRAFVFFSSSFSTQVLTIKREIDVLLSFFWQILCEAIFQFVCFYVWCSLSYHILFSSQEARKQENNNVIFMRYLSNELFHFRSIFFPAFSPSRKPREKWFWYGSPEMRAGW